MEIKLGTRLLSDNNLHAVVLPLLSVINEPFVEFLTANAQLELGKDYRGRDIVRLIVKEHGRTVQTAFSPDEFDNEAHLRNRLYQFVGQVATLEVTNDCPNCGKKYNDSPLPL